MNGLINQKKKAVYSLIDTENLNNNLTNKPGPLNPLENLFSKKKNIQINSKFSQSNLNLL